MSNKQVNWNIVDGDSFYAHELTANFTPLQFALDFKNITPRIDPRVKDRPSFTLKHNVVTIDPWQAKQVFSVLKNALSQYESRYGKIKKPAALAKAEKSQHEKPEESHNVPSYFG